jgi:putative membrane protein
LIAYSIALKQHLQGDRNQEEFKPFVDSQTMLDSMEDKRNRPLYLLRELDKAIKEALIHSYELSSQSNSLSVQPKYYEKGFHDNCHSLNVQLGCCERILKQPVPLSYSRHSSRFLSLYMLSLPFSLVASLGWLTIPVVSAICWSFVSIQEIGHFIEEPFNKLTQVIPLNQIISVIWYDTSGKLTIDRSSHR